MAKDRRNFTGTEKLVILREHLIEKVPISEVCDRQGLQPTVFYQWQKKLFEDGTAYQLPGVERSPVGWHDHDWFHSPIQSSGILRSADLTIRSPGVLWE